MKKNKIIQKFEKERERNIIAQGQDEKLKKRAVDWVKDTSKYNYTYNFSWLGRPIIQFPQDVMVMQEIIWKVKPDLIIETGIAHGGSLIFYASMLELIGHGRVLGVDIDIREHNRKEIEKHKMYKRIDMIEGSSVDPETIKKIKRFISKNKKVLVTLDSDHTHQHVLQELNLYAPFVTKGSYLVVFDTAIEDMPNNFYIDRPWGKGNNPRTAVVEFLKNNKNFLIDRSVGDKAMISVSPDGYLKKIK